MQKHYNYFRDYDPSIGRYIESDPIGQEAGRDTFGYVRAAPLRFTDVFGLDVLMCSRPTHFDLLGIQFSIGSHYWLKTNSSEAGMGAAGEGVPGQGNSDYPGVSVSVNDHTGQSRQPGSSCRLVKDQDEDCVNKELQLGRKLGRWWPNNQCFSFTQDVIRKCSTRPPHSDPTPIPGRRS